MNDVLVVAPFRRPTFRKAISDTYPVEEPWDSPPLVVAGALEAAGLSVQYLALQNIFDAWSSEQHIPVLRRMIEEADARSIVFAGDNFVASRSTATVYGVGVVSAVARERDPDVLIGVVGRLATTGGPRVLESVPECDFLVHGEAEVIIGSLLEEMLRTSVDEVDHPSLVTRRSVAAGIVPEAAMVQNLDDAPLPAWHLLGSSIRWWDETKAHRSQAVLPFSLRTSAGCKFQCRFCAGVPNWLNYRMKSADRFAVEVDSLVAATAGRARFSFLEDEILTRHLDHVTGISKVCVDRNVRFDGVYTHSSLLTEEVAQQLAPMTRSVFLGLDSANDDVLRDMRKGQRFENVLTAIDTARKHGVGVHLEWIIGSPPDTVDSMLTNLNMITTLYSTGVVDSLNTYVYCPHPGTAYVENAEAFGLHVVDDFEDMQEIGGYPSYFTENLSRQQIFTAYLMSQVAIGEISRMRDRGQVLGEVGLTSRAELRRIFDKIAAG